MSRDASPFQTFGEELRSARQAQHRSIDEIAERTRINRRYIEAIESGDLSQLPSGPYTQAFLKEYARAVGCKIPDALLGVTNTASTSASVPLRSQTVIRDSSRDAKPEASSKGYRPSLARGARTPASSSEPRDESEKPLGTTAVEQLGAAYRATKELPKIANQAAKTAARSAARTTETVIKRVETGAKDAVGAITSKSLWEEAEQVRRERRGLPPIPETESNSVRVSSDAVFNVRDLKENVTRQDPHTSGVSNEGVHPEPQRPLIAAANDIAPSHYENESEDDEAFATPPKNTRKGAFSPTNVVIGCVVLLFAGVLAFALHLNKQDKTPSDVAQSSEVAKEKPAKEKAVVAPAKPVAAAPTIDSLRFVVKAISPVWVSIMPDSRTPFKGELKAGDSKSFAASDKFVVNLGNQQALEMTYNGQALSHLPTIANSGVVVRDLVLTRDHVTLGGKSVAMNGAATTTSTNKPAPPTKAALPASTTPSTKTPLVPAHHSLTVKKPADVKPHSSTTPKPKQNRASKRPVKNTIPPIDPLPARP